MDRQDTIEHATDVALASVASKTTQVGAFTVIGGWWFTNEAAVLYGLVIGLGGLILNWYYRRKADRREEELHKLKIKELSDSSN